jgi:hypothetical protein
MTPETLLNRLFWIVSQGNLIGIQGFNKVAPNPLLFPLLKVFITFFSIHSLTFLSAVPLPPVSHHSYIMYQSPLSQWQEKK